ncbi:hypothetical protein AGMMS49587_01440 [Spirochaetia bacterium]|nr:hypothetical protein AGMMS49587_01440 [Spirochaetia bacterium]
MAAAGTLDRLASELPMEERQDLLEKLKAQSGISSEPLYEAPGEGVFAAGTSITIEEQYAKLPWYYRLYYFFLSFFRNKAPILLFADTQVARLGREIDAAFPGLYDYQQGILHGEFYRLLSGLKEAARFFFEALDLSINRDRGAFYAFLGSLEMGETHERLRAETEIKTIAEKNSAPINSPRAVAEAEIRQTALRAMEDIFAGIPGDQRDTMYRNARSLHCLKELSSFLFDRVLMAFNPPGGEARPRLPEEEQAPPADAVPACSVYVVREMLGSLNNILCSLRDPLPLTLLESLFIFILQAHSRSVLMEREEFGTEQEIQNLLHQAEKAMVIIRNFNRHIPLTLILRCANRDMSLSPKTVSGGEDWFAMYRDYWKRHIEDQFAAYQLASRCRDILASFQVFFKGAELKTLDGVAAGISGTNPEGFPLAGAFTLAFLRTFHLEVFMEDMNRFLKPIMDEGKFFKPETQDKFTAGYNDLIKLEDDIRKLERRIAPSGEYGKRYTMAEKDMSALPVKQRKIQIVADEAALEAGKIISRVRDAAAAMIGILKGILKKEPQGRNEFLVNLAHFMGEGSTFAVDITGVIRQFEGLLQLLDDIDVMESGRN